MAQLNVILYLQCSVLALLHSCTVQGCLYEYTSHPMTNMTCDPFGSSLKLHCEVTGPLYPQFHIQWHLVTAADQILGTRLGTENDTYQVDSMVLNKVGEVEMEECSILSVLTTGIISDMHQNQCISCQVEFDGMGVSLDGNDTKFCLGSVASYTALPSCSADFVIRNSTAVCVTSQDFLEPTPSSSSSPSQPPPTLPASLLTAPTMLSPTSFPISTPTQMHHPAATIVLPPPSTIAPSPSNNTAPGGNQAAVEGGLFVAIGICIIFIVIIIILMYFVIRLFRQWRWNREKKQDQSEYANDVDASVPPNPAVALARGYSVERIQMDSESLFLDEDIILTTRSLQDLSRIQAVPPIPPRPWKNKMVKANSASALNSRGLSHGAASVSLARGYNNFTFPDRTERPMEDPDIPPPIPVRSKSRDHFYHTLECPENGDSGIASVSSPQYSQHRSTSSTGSSQAGQEDEPEQAQQLFDDPRYVALQVEEEGILRERKEIWRSTPALASMNIMGRGESDRRSLRLTHVVGTEIYN